MRTVEEIKADIASCDSSWIDSARCRSLRCELYETILDGIPLDRLETICAAEKDGRLVTLPCKVGDMVYVVDTVNGITDVYERHATVIMCNGWEGEFFVKVGLFWSYRIADFGKTVFLTRAEAEKALGKEQGHDE